MFTCTQARAHMCTLTQVIRRKSVSSVLLWVLLHKLNQGKYFITLYSVTIILGSSVVHKTVNKLNFF
jgi:hypothetical protein